MRDRATLFLTVDTEEDNWQPARSGITIENIRELPGFERFLERSGLRATYLCTYQVVRRDWAAEILRSIQEAGRSEIGAHLHPWNTPPIRTPLTRHLTMLSNLPGELQEAKLRTLTELLRTRLGVAPVSFRAGRYALGQATVRALLDCGYRVDSSLTPFINWEADGGPNYERTPLAPFRLRAGAADGSREDRGLWEVPLSSGYSRRPFRLWHRVHRILDRPALRRMRVLGLARRLGIIQTIVLSPEFSTPDQMLLLSRRLLEEGVDHLQLSLHSPSLRPGLTPYTRTSAEVDRFLGSIESYVERLAGMADLEFATIGEAAVTLPRRG